MPGLVPWRLSVLSQQFPGVVRVTVGNYLCVCFTGVAKVQKEGTKQWRSALIAARPQVPAAPGRHRKGTTAAGEGVDLDEVEDLEDPVVAEGPQVADGSDDDRFDDAGVPLCLLVMSF